jgi:light-regulated signal transduction histidine kinase (bacteriophytochrome)
MDKEKMERNLHDDLIRENRELETRLQKCSADLVKSTIELERFAYAASHDLKSPLVAIKGFLGLLSKDLQTGNGERIARDLQHIALATDQMDRSLDGLLKITRIGLVVNTPQRFSLSELCEEVKNMLQELVTRNDIEIEIAPDMPEVFADKTQISDAMQKILENAIKFCQEDVKPKISFNAEIQGNRVQCRVKDNGIGIDSRYLDRIFGLFEQLNQGIDGTGVGLALVKRIIESHDGEVWAESDGDGEGASIYFTLDASL